MPIRVVALVEAATLTGPVKNLLAFCRMARQAGSIIDLSIAAFFRNSSSAASSNPFLDAVRSAGIELDVIPERGRFDRSVIPAIGRILERRRPDVIQTHAVKSHFLVRYAGFHRRIPWIAFHHGYTAEDFKMRLYVQLDRWSLRAAPHVITVCEPFAADLVRAGVPRDRIQILPNAVAPPPVVTDEQVCALRRRLAVPQGARILLSIGRFSREKGHSDLIAALQLLSRDRPGLSLCLLLVGDGIERPALERAAASSMHRVIFTGHQPDVWPLFAIADLFVLPSHSEGSPNVLLEAMAAKIPVVATAVGGVPETVENGQSALLVPPRSPSELARAIARLLDDPALLSTLAANAYSRVAACFSPQARMDALLRLYRLAAPDRSAIQTEGGR